MFLQAMRHEKPTTILIGVRPQMRIRVRTSIRIRITKIVQILKLRQLHPIGEAKTPLGKQRPRTTHHIPAAYGVHRVPAVHMCASVPKHITRLTTATTTRPSTTQHIQQRTAFTGCLQCTGVL